MTMTQPDDAGDAQTWAEVLELIKAMPIEEIRAAMLRGRYRWAGGDLPSDREREIIKDRRSRTHGGSVPPTQEERDRVWELARAVFDGSVTVGMTIGDDDEWINTESGTLHRGRCVTAAHMLDGLTQAFEKGGETAGGQPVLERASQNHSAHIAPVGLGIGYTRVCGRCKPRTPTGNAEVEVLSPQDIRVRITALLARAGMPLDELRSRAETYSLTPSQQGLLDQIEGLTYLGSEDAHG